MEAMEIREILEHLPHRYPFLLIDRVLELEVGKRILGLKNVTMNEPYFTGHFPGNPVMPGVLIVEALAQAAGILSFKTMQRRPDSNSVIYFAAIDGARFKKPVVPGDQVKLEVIMRRLVRGVGKFDCRAVVGEAVVAEAQIMAALREV